MTQTLIMLAQGLDPETFREAMRYALQRKLTDAAMEVQHARMELSLPNGADTASKIIELAPIARLRVNALVAALDDLDAVIAEVEEAWKSIEAALPREANEEAA